MASKKKRRPSKTVRAARGASVVGKKGVPWLTILSVAGIVALAGTVGGYYFVKTAGKREQAAREEAAAAFVPSASNPDPSNKIDGVFKGDYAGRAHLRPPERVKYDRSPPVGGPHDGTWATCTGTVYPNAVRTENMVHSLEHGAVWIAYNPQLLSGDALEKLKSRVQSKPFSMMSPYPGLDKPISLQSWGHQLKVDSVDDQRIDQFIVALRQNPNGVYPEVGATCDSVAPEQLPPFDPTPPGSDAKPMDYKGSEGAAQDQTPPGQPPVTPRPGG
ncbi:DUF3105 domain-containing protein [Amycolatopsis roodepoortensis]|uniref:DUF3105 domain-containing protein n=1 Tax=Amycolatopsis roodepoortensis TaxID=700274 RepID=UPI00214BED30|nr:DUF3105 domain-containing protein [Amycolatopsis roodepoortensis]UUV35893.1 DUF3105 domain-containing protein [Amycolatopsis roodepoortensis]